MTAQTNLELIWALTGGVTDPGDVKYSTGWVSEIPTFQNFNFVLQNHSKNILALAESGQFDWQIDIAYTSGAKVLRGDRIFTCRTNTIGQDPLTDTAGNFWIYGDVKGNTSLSDARAEFGQYLKNINPRASATTWDGSDQTIQNASALIELITTNIASKNWILGNVSGELVAIDLDTDSIADGRSIALADPATHRLFHEGHPPIVAEVSGAVEEVPTDGIIYARKDGAWVVVAGNIVSSEPPPPSVGAGTGWYNLADGKYYIDINDGDSSQWVPANPPLIPEMVAAQIGVSDTGHGFTNVQMAIDALASDRTNLFDNTKFVIQEIASNEIFLTAGVTAKFCDRWAVGLTAGSVGTYAARVTLGLISNLDSHAYFPINTWTSGTAFMEQVITAYNAQNKDYSVSFNASSTVSQTFSVKLFDDTTLIDTQTVVVGTGDVVNQRFGVSFATIPDSLMLSGLRVRIEWSVPANVSFMDMQAERGPAATAYRTPGVAAERLECMRYFQRLDGIVAYATTMVNTGDLVAWDWQFPVQMIDIPTVNITATNVSTVIGTDVRDSSFSWLADPTSPSSAVSITSATANADV